MAKKENAGKSPMVDTLKLFNRTTGETRVITDEEMAQYDARLWQIVEGEVKSPGIRLEEIEAKRPKREIPE